MLEYASSLSKCTSCAVSSHVMSTITSTGISGTSQLHWLLLYINSMDYRTRSVYTVVTVDRYALLHTTGSYNLQYWPANSPEQSPKNVQTARTTAVTLSLLLSYRDGPKPLTVLHPFY